MDVGSIYENKSSSNVYELLNKTDYNSTIYANGELVVSDLPGYITPDSNIRLLYKFKLQPGLLDRKHFMIITYPWTNSFETIIDSLNLENPDSQITARESYRNL